MRVIATAGHAGHGKSTLVRRLTGMDPHRWEPGGHPGATTDLGCAWLTLPSGEKLAFVDVPGHERLIPTMIAGVGSVPAVLFVVAADEGRKPQSEGHLAVLNALGIRRGLLVVTRADLADPTDPLSRAQQRIAASSLGEVEAVAASTVTGEGLLDLVAGLARLASSLPERLRRWPDVDPARRPRGSSRPGPTRPPPLRCCAGTACCGLGSCSRWA